MIGAFINYNFDTSLSQKILTAFDMIDLAVEKGHEFVLQKYKDVMQVGKEQGQQKGVFDF